MSASRVPWRRAETHKDSVCICLQPRPVFWLLKKAPATCGDTRHKKNASSSLWLSLWLELSSCECERVCVCVLDIKYINPLRATN